MKRLNLFVMTAFMAVSSATLASAQSETEPLSAIPYLTEINKAGFNVTVRKPASETTEPEKDEQMPVAASAAEPVKSMHANRNKDKSIPVKNTVKLGLSADGNLTVDGVKTFLIKPERVIVSKKDARAMKGLSCARRGAKKVDLGYTVYTVDGASLGYMVDYKLKPGSHFDTFRVVSFPTHLGKPVCLQFDGTNPYPNDRVRNQPKVSVTLDAIKSGTSGNLVR
ncbi:hypothetical protein [Pseudosulfitobacter pseudonitzschiae]|uniref:hypothetical protein n=1 Tax=Pseudosulfitobacter pseudonitzschiae TaxID=1402135 RepID=UPI003B7F2832